jgi:hypothetical protein
MDPMQRLHESLNERATPGQVCALIPAVVGGRMMPAQRRVLHRAEHGDPRTVEGFAPVLAAVHKVRTLMALFDKQLSDESIVRMASDPWVLLAQLQFLAPFLGWMGGDFGSAAPLNRQQRTDMGIGVPRRRYRRLVRQMRALQQQAYRMQSQVLLRQLRLVGHCGMAYSIRLEEMRADPDAAVFAAYWVALRNRPEPATPAGQLDVVARMLLDRCELADGTDWWLIARACPLPGIVARLTDRQRGELMAQWMQFMRLAADLMDSLRQTWGPGFDLAGMRARAGIDWWTWNTLADSYNAARAGWIACLDAAGCLRLLNAICPGKAVRLASGPGDDPETAVWAALPKPWEVLDGTSCTARTVELVCRQCGVDPRATGWTGPAPYAVTAQWAPTQELQDGIRAGDPIWAGVLDNAGAFAGQKEGPRK